MSNYSTVQTQVRSFFSEKISAFFLFLLLFQIYIALSDLIMLMGSETNPVPEIIQRFNKPPDRMNALIEFLTILPEEVRFSAFPFLAPILNILFHR